MIYLLCGQDDFRMRARVNQIYIEAVERHPDLELIWLGEEKLLVGDLQAALSAQSLLSGYRLVVVKNLLSAADDMAKWFTQWLASQNREEVDLAILETEAPSKNGPWRNFLPEWKLELYPLLSDSAVRNWLDQQIKNRQLIAPAAVGQYLVVNFGSDLWRLTNELDKLALFADGQPITKDILEQVVVPTLPDNIFKVVEALARKDLRSANIWLNNQLAVGTPEEDLLGLIAYQFRVIASLKAWREKGATPQELPQKSGLHPYVVKKNLEFAKTFSWPQLQRIFYLLQKIDTAIKLSQTPPRIGLDILAAQIVSS